MSFNFGFNKPGTTTTQQSGTKPAAFTFGTQASQTTTSPSFSFGSKTGTSTSTASTTGTPSFSFGGAPTGATPSFSFGTTTGTNTPTFSFGATGGTSTSTTGGGFTFGGQSAQNQQPLSQDSSQVSVRIQSIIEQINGGPYDRFKFAFYNKGDPNKYRKPDKMSEVMWRDASIRNPDTKNLVPVLDLQLRRELQNKQRQEQEEVMRKIEANIEEQQYKQQLFLGKLTEYRKTIAHNILRILRLLGRAEYIRRKGQPLNRNEEHLFSQLDKMRDELHRPGQETARLHELDSNVKASRLNPDEIEYPSLDKETIENIQEILAHYVKALTSVVKDVNRNVKALDIIEKSFKESAIEASTQK